ncbi:hypothetical protein V0R37_22105, partial [Pollutimonas sp. H1-120]|uniref:hypothetical protein n=1 Tax=Pollutimonas sp. H1-120 TaxID=3148824 RepID=UPI003B5260E6
EGAVVVWLRETAGRYPERPGQRRGSLAKPMLAKRHEIEPAQLAGLRVQLAVHALAHTHQQADGPQLLGVPAAGRDHGPSTGVDVGKPHAV